MTTQMLYANWKASRWLLVPFVVLAFGFPLMVLRGGQLLGGPPDLTPTFERGYAMLYVARGWAPFFSLLAFVTGFAIALAVWAWDHRSNHTYALSLPISRSSYVLKKMLTGAALLLIPAAAVLLAALIGQATIELPEGVRVYAFTFTARFLLAAGLAYALGFALAAGTIRTTLIITVGVTLVLVFGSIAVVYLRDAFGLPGLRTPIELLYSALVSWPGPFNVFGGSWLLVDV